MTSNVRLIFIGGFLGAGKTTLMWRCAERLLKRDLRVGLITNDQAPDLVDTHWLQSRGVAVGEVAGSCFCCNFTGLIEAAGRVQQHAPADVLIAEPVGSCTDLSATILQPLKHRFRNRFIISPLTVLADPQRLREVLSRDGDTLHDDAAYIFRKQLEEADVIAINKTDSLDASPRHSLVDLVRRTYPGIEIVALSAQTGDGVGEWLDDMLRRGDAGRRVVEVDYDTYANGEAVLGWLNALVELRAAPEIDWSSYVSELLGDLGAEFAQRKADVGHVKLWITAAGHELVGNLTRSGGQPVIRATTSGKPALAAQRGDTARMVLNARVEMSPQNLKHIVGQVLARHESRGIRASIQHMHCLQPGRPTPTHRYAQVVAVG